MSSVTSGWPGAAVLDLVEQAGQRRAGEDLVDHVDDGLAADEGLHAHGLGDLGQGLARRQRQQRLAEAALGRAEPLDHRVDLGGQRLERRSRLVFAMTL